MINISASILSAKNNLENTILELNDLDIEYIHLDIMDGIYVNNTSFNEDDVSVLLKYSKKPIDVHLMVMDINSYVNYYIKNNVESISIHYELIDSFDIISKIKDNNIKVGIAINPDMPIEVIFPILDKIDKVLLMSVKPGFGGQEFIPSTLDKIEKLRKEINRRKLNVLISVDGGINNNSSIKCIEKGADILVIGSALINNENRKEFINSVKSHIKVN